MFGPFSSDRVYYLRAVRTYGAKDWPVVLVPTKQSLKVSVFVFSLSVFSLLSFSLLVSLVTAATQYFLTYSSALTKMAEEFSAIVGPAA
jgi:hypothetical protein